MKMNFLSFTIKPEMYFEDVEFEGRAAQVIHASRVSVTVYVPPRGVSSYLHDGQGWFSLLPSLPDSPVFLDIVTYFQDLRRVSDAVWENVEETFRILEHQASQIHSELQYAGQGNGYRDWREAAECWTYHLVHAEKLIDAGMVLAPKFLEYLTDVANDVLRWLVVREKMHWKE